MWAFMREVFSTPAASSAGADQYGDRDNPPKCRVEQHRLSNETLQPKTEPKKRAPEVVSQTAVGSRKAAIVSEFLSEMRWGDSNQQWQLEAGSLRAAEGVDLDDEDESDEDEMDEINEDEGEFDEDEDLEDEFEEEEEEESAPGLRTCG